MPKILQNLAKITCVTFLCIVCEIMLTVEEVKSLINAELEPVKAKFAHYDQKIRELETSLTFFSGKYDTLISQVQSSNGKYNGLERN